MDITSESSVPLPYCADITTHNAATINGSNCLNFWVALLARDIESGMCFILWYTVYILYTYVLQSIINSTMYTIVSVCVLFSNFGNINAVYMYFYPDEYSKFDLIKVLKLLAALTLLTCNNHSD